jgi:hypothetical protein
MKPKNQNQNRDEMPNEIAIAPQIDTGENPDIAADDILDGERIELDPQ